MFSNTDVSVELMKKLFNIKKEESFHSDGSSQNLLQSYHWFIPFNNNLQHMKDHDSFPKMMDCLATLHWGEEV